MSNVGEKLIMEMLMVDVGDVGEKLVIEKERAELGDAEENLLWKPQNVQVSNMQILKCMLAKKASTVMDFKHD